MTQKFPARDEVRNRLKQIFAEAGPDNDLSNVKSISGSNEEKARAIAELNSQLEEYDKIASAANRANSTGGTEPGSEPGGSDFGGGTKDVARRTVDALHKSAKLPDHAAERCERMLTTSDQKSRQAMDEWIQATGNPAYEGAFAKIMSDPHRGHMLWSKEEQAAFAQVKAMSISPGSSGGFMVPAHLDPSILLTSDGSTNPLRRIARVETIAVDAWNGVTSAGVTAEWLAEGAEAADASPSLNQPSVPVHKGSAWIPYSFEVGMDGQNFTGELQRLLGSSADELMSTAYMNGSGSGQPQGFTTGLASGSKVAAATADTLVADDVFGIQNSLPARFQPSAQWLSNLTTANQVQQFETANGAKVFPEISNGTLLRKNWNEASHLDTAGDTTNAGNDNVLAYGDFSNFLIVDRIGTVVEPVDNVMGSNGRPTGQRGLFMWFRTGSDVLVDNAFRLLTA